MSEQNHLFSQNDWNDIIENQKKKLKEEVAKIDGSKLLNTSLDDLCDYFYKKYLIDVPILNKDQMFVDQAEASVDVSNDPLRFNYNREGPFYQTGTKIEATIPFTGKADVFKIRPSTFSLSPPQAIIRNSTLIIEIKGIELESSKVKEQIDKTLADINTHLDRLRKDVDSFNKDLPQLAQSVIEKRRTKLLKDQNLVSSLGYPLKKRADTPKTFVAPEVRKKIKPKLPEASTMPYAPEPILSYDDYNYVLNIIKNMARVMELSPSAFTSMNEEALRSHFLVQLNGHYEGGATGETFNYEGKTDILVRVENKNIFIAECKYWKGPKMLTDTIDQLLSYSSWRDTKVAIIVFNKNKNFTDVLEIIKPTVVGHSNCKKFIEQPFETEFRFKFSHKDDPNRELDLTVLVFDVPNQ